MKGASGKRHTKSERGFFSPAIIILGLLVIFAPILIFGTLYLFSPPWKAELEYLGKRGKNVVAHYLLGQKPHFYRLILEKNGVDESLGEGEALNLSYRDELVIKEVVTDALGGRGVSVDVEGLGEDNDYRKYLQATALVDAVIRKRVAPREGKGANGARLVVKYQGETIATLPVVVEITPQDWLRHARSTDNVTEQIDFLQNALALNPADTSVRKTLAGLYEGQGKTKEAVEQYRQILKLAPKDLTSLRLLLRIQAASRDYDGVIKTGQEIIRLEPAEEKVRQQMALAYINQGKLDRAIVLYQEILQDPAADPTVHYRLGELYEKTGNIKKALEHYQIARSKRPKDPNIMAALAETSLKAGNNDEAIKWLKELIRVSPKNAGFHALMAMAYAAKGQLKEEIESYEQSLKIKSDDQTVRFNLAVAYEKSNRDREAAEAYAAILKARPTDVEVMERLANALYRLKDFSGALKHYERLVKTDKKPRKTGHIYLNMAYAYGELKRYAQSAESYEAALKQGLKDPMIFYNLAATYRHLENNHKAAENYEKYAAQQPNAEVLSFLADHYMSNNQFEKAIKSYLRWLELDRSRKARASIYSSLALAHGKLGNLDKEIEFYRMSLKFDPEDALVHFSLGEAYETKRMYQEAKQAYEKAVAYDPASEKARKKALLMGVRVQEEKIK